MKKGKASWKTRFGFYFAAMGSAFGLGNLWRFPYVVTENGGGAFVLLYIFLVFVVGIPLLIGELLLGKIQRQGIVKSLEGHSNGRPSSSFFSFAFPYVGSFTVVLCMGVLAYFAVISGWVMHYFIQFFLGYFKGAQFFPQEIIYTLRENGWLQLLLASVHILIVVTIVVNDVQDGIEKWVGYLMPAFALLLIILAANALTLDTSNEALRFMLYPDFSKLNIFSFGEALGHLCFTLSIGFGALVTFGSYLKEEDYVPTAGFRVSIMDATLSLFSGLLIFPLIIQTQDTVSGPELLFQAVPNFLPQVKGGIIFGIGFFLCLYFAALGASIGLLESIVSNVKQKYKVNRFKATWMSGVVCFVVSVIPALSSSTLNGVTYHGYSLLELIDKAIINWMLPLSALFISWAVSQKLSKERIIEEFVNENNMGSQKLYAHWHFSLRWIVPIIIILALTLQLFGLISGGF